MDELQKLFDAGYIIKAGYSGVYGDYYIYCADKMYPLKVVYTGRGATPNDALSELLKNFEARND